jgi:hypothetical protein
MLPHPRAAAFLLSMSPRVHVHGGAAILSVSCKRGGDSEQTVIECVAGLHRTLGNPRASSHVEVARATQEVVPCSSGTRRGSRHVSSFPPQWRQPRWHRSTEEEEEERRPGAVALQRPRRRRHPRRARLRHRTPHPPRVRHPLRRHRHHAPRRRSQRRDMRLRKPPRRARFRKRHALRRSTLPVHPAVHPLRLRRSTRSSHRRPPDGAAALNRGLRNRRRAKTSRNSPGRVALPPRQHQGAAAATPRHNKTLLRNKA